MKVLFLVLFLMFLVPTFADTYVNMSLTGLGPNGLSVFNASNMWGGEPISPYQATSGGETFLVACLDLALNTYVGRSYTYDITTPATNDSTDLQLYGAAAILTQQLLVATGDARGELSFAIWYLFNEGAVTGSTNTQVKSNLTTITGYATDALDQAGTGSVPNYTVYYPVTAGAPPTLTSSSQRFIRLVPDGGVTLMLLGGALVGLETLRRRSRA